MKRPVADKRGYRGIQLSTEQAKMTGDGPIILRRERSLLNAGKVRATREMAVKACKAAIDKLLGLVL